MTLQKRNYVDGQTVITAKNLNDIQDAIIELEENPGISDYEDLTNKPQINGTELSGNKSAEDLGLVDAEDFEQYQQSVQAKFNELGLYRDADGDLCEE